MIRKLNKAEAEHYKKTIDCPMHGKLSSTALLLWKDLNNKRHFICRLCYEKQLKENYESLIIQ